MEKAESYDVELFPGDVLYIPMRWWHSGFNSGDVIGANAWFYVPNPFAGVLDWIFSHKLEDYPQDHPKLPKLPEQFAALQPLPAPPRTPPMGVHPDMVKGRIQQRQQKLGCVRAQVRPFKKVFAELKQYKEELTCLRGAMRGIWQEATELVNGDYPGGSVELWRKTGHKSWTLGCPDASPQDQAAFEQMLRLRHDKDRFSFAGLLELAYPGCAARGACVEIHQALGKALRSAVVWGKCKGGARKAEL